MPKRKAPPAGGKADAKAGTDALRRLVVFFSHDKTEIYGQDAPLGQEGADAAQKALGYLEAGDAQQAVWWALRAADVYRRIEKLALGVERADQMRDTADWWQTTTRPAVEKETARLRGKAEQPARTKARAEAAIKHALKLMADGWGKTKAQRDGAKKHGTSLATVRSYWSEFAG